MLGYQFYRQKPIDSYIIDFFSCTLRLVIEIDGDSHDDHTYEYDKKRQNDLESFGLTVLRFDDHEVKKDMNNVLRVIENLVLDN